MTLGVNFNLPPDKALQFFRSKGLQESFAWQDMRDAQHDQDFTVAKMMDLDLLAEVHAAVEKAMAEGSSFEEFKKGLKPLLIAKGWWGKQEVVDPLTGETVLAQLGSSRRLQTIFDVNMATSYAAGHWQGIVKNAKHSPYLLYNAVDDSRTRPQHRSWDGLVLRWDDPWWKTHFPPNGWRCRCTVIQLNDEDLQGMGKSGPDASPKIQYRDWTNPRTGEVERLPTGIDPGWDYHPGRDKGEQLARQFMDKAGVAPANLGAAAFRQVSTNMLSSLEAEFGQWVDDVVARGLPAGKTAIVGMLAAEDLAFMRNMGVDPANAGILVEDRLLVGKKVDRHQDSGNGLTTDDWKAMPAALAVPERVLWDVRNKTLLYVFPAEADKSIKLAVAVNYQLKKQGVVNMARTAFKVTADRIDAAIQGGDYVEVR